MHHPSLLARDEINPLAIDPSEFLVCFHALVQRGERLLVVGYTLRSLEEVRCLFAALVRRGNLNDRRLSLALLRVVRQLGHALFFRIELGIQGVVLGRQHSRR